MKHTFEELKQWQSLPLSVKVLMTKARIREWIKTYGEDGVYISFSGGKDSTVLLDLVRQDYPNVPALFVDVPTQYPELREFATSFENVEVVRPKMTYVQVCEKYGFPFINKETSNAVYQARIFKRDMEKDANVLKKYPYGKPIRVLQLEGKMPHRKDGELTGEYSKQFDKSRYAYLLDAPFEISDSCCRVLKKNPANSYERRSGRKYPFLGQLASESKQRQSQWMRFGCNGFQKKHPVSNPLSFWREKDILQYIAEKHLPICSVYGEVMATDEDGMLYYPETLQTMSIPLDDCDFVTTGCSRTGCMLCGFGCHLEKSPNRFEQLKVTHPGMYKLLDVVKNNGVTMREAIEWMNENGGTDIKL